MARFRTSLGRQGSALLNVIIFAAMMAVMIPLMMDFYKSNSKATAYNRDLMTRSLNYQIIMNYSYSPAALYRTYIYSTRYDGALVQAEASNPSAPTWPANQRINSCYRLCLGGFSTSTDKLNACQSPVLTSGASGTPTASNVCASRDASDKALWYHLTLFHPTDNGVAVAGPDPYATAADPWTRNVMRYTLEGEKCPYAYGTTGWTNNCPFEAKAYFHPICEGDAWLQASSDPLAQLERDPGTQGIPIGPPVVAVLKSRPDGSREAIPVAAATRPAPPAPTLPMVPTVPAVPVTRVDSAPTLLKRWSEELLSGERKADAKCCAVLKDLDDRCNKIPPGLVVCPNNPCQAYNPGNAGVGCDCCGWPIGSATSTMTLTATTTITATTTDTTTATGTGTGGCDMTNAMNYCSTQCISHSGPSSAACNGAAYQCTCIDSATFANAAYDACCKTGTQTATSTGSYVRTCTAADSIIVWFQISWVTSGPWANDKRWAGLKTLDSNYDHVGDVRRVSDVPHTKVCGKIFSSDTNPIAGMCP